MTPNDDAYRLLAEYAAGNLSEREREELFRAALNDAEIFEALVEEEELREALEDSLFRRRVKERLRALGAEKEPHWTRIWNYIASPKGMLATAGAVASIAAVILVQTGVFRPTPALIRVTVGSGDGAVVGISSLTAEAAAPTSSKGLDRPSIQPDSRAAVVQLDRTGQQPEYRIGDRQRIGFRLEKDGNAFLFEDLPDGTSYRLFPNRFQESPIARAGETILVPPSGQGDLEVQGPTGPRELRLVVFPAGANPLVGDAWDRLKDQAREVRQGYEVKGN